MVKARSVRPYYQGTRDTVYDRFSRSYPQLVDDHRYVSTLSKEAKRQFLQDERKNARQIDNFNLIEIEISTEKLHLRESNEQLEIDLVMYGYLGTTGTYAADKMFHRRAGEALNFLTGAY